MIESSPCRYILLSWSIDVDVDSSGIRQAKNVSNLWEWHFIVVPIVVF
jgi:hypothetical protein